MIEENNMMKIAFLNIYQGLVDRGAETYVKELAERLKAKHEVVVIGGNALPPRRWPFLWRFFIDPNGLYIFWWTASKIPLIWKNKFDVIIPLNGGWQPAIIRIITWLYRGKMIISGQSGRGWDDRNNLITFPDAFVSLSTQNKNWAKKTNPFIRVEYIPNGVDLSSFNPAGRKREFNLKRPIILCVGALTPNKRIDLAIAAVAKLSKGSLAVVGDGDLKDDIYNLGKKLLDERFQLMKAKFEELPEIYRAADIFTLPSQSFQSFEIVLVEAMATNLPVVANDDPIRREIVGEGGILIDPRNSDGYARALESALEKNWGSKPRSQADKFSWDKIAKQYEELFGSITKS